MTTTETLTASTRPFEPATGNLPKHGFKFPRAGLRLEPDGKWRLSIWLTPEDRDKRYDNLTFAAHHRGRIFGTQIVSGLRSQQHPAGQRWHA